MRCHSERLQELLFQPLTDRERLHCLLDTVADTASMTAPMCSRMTHSSQLCFTSRDQGTDS